LFRLNKRRLGPERGSEAFVPDVDAKIDIRHFLFAKLSRQSGPILRVRSGEPPLCLSTSQAAFVRLLSLHQSFIYEVTASPSSARCSLLVHASRLRRRIPSDEIEIRCLGI